MNRLTEILSAITEAMQERSKDEQRRKLGQLLGSLVIEIEELHPGKELTQQEVAELIGEKYPTTLNNIINNSGGRGPGEIFRLITSAATKVDELAQQNNNAHGEEAQAATSDQDSSVLLLEEKLKEKEEEIDQLTVSRRNFIWGSGLGFVGTIGGGVVGYTLKKELEASNDRYEKYKLWSAFRKQDETEEELKKGFNNLIKEIKKILKPESGTKATGVSALLKAFKVSAPADCKQSPPDYSAIDFEKNDTHVTPYSIYHYDLKDGVYYFSPDGTPQEDNATNLFCLLNAEIKGTPIENSTLESRLANLIGFPPDDDFFAPILIYAFIFKTTDNTKAHMYRYPSYLDFEQKNPRKPYEKYNHNDRPFFNDYTKNECYELGAAEGWKVLLSSVYSDYKQLTVTPIRTLIYETIVEDHTYLLCIDFKFKDKLKS